MMIIPAAVIGAIIFLGIKYLGSQLWQKPWRNIGSSRSTKS